MLYAIMLFVGGKRVNVLKNLNPIFNSKWLYYPFLLHPDFRYIYYSVIVFAPCVHCLVVVCCYQLSVITHYQTSYICVFKFLLLGIFNIDCFSYNIFFIEYIHKSPQKWP